MPLITKILFVRKLNAPTNEQVSNIIQAISMRAIAGGIEIVDESSITLAEPTLLIVSVGGDGTMLYAMRLAAKHHCLCTGFHAGHLGFLNDFASDEDINGAVDTLFDVLGDTWKMHTYTEERMSISVLSMNGFPMEPSKSLALNEVAVSRVYSDQLLEYTLNINGQNVGTHRANSILISTPTGSTAYALSAGGAIVYPSSSVLQLVPVAPNTLSSRPLIIPMFTQDNYPTTISISIHGGDASVRVDGTKPTFNGDEITQLVMQPVLATRILHSPKWNFYNTLTNKLGWFNGS